MSITITTIKIAYEHDTVLSRQRARQIASLLGFELRDQTAVSTAVSEIVRNTLSYAGEGSIEFIIDERSSPQMFIIRVSDNGPGIKDLDVILSGRYKSATGMGMGILGSRRLMDYFHIESAPGKGTTVVLGKELPKGKIVKTEDIGAIAAELVKLAPRNFLEEVQQQNQELMRTLDELKKRQDELVRLNRELEETNRGVVALYAELDERADHLKNANDLKARFLSNISHEFRTPLNSILGLSKLLLDRTDGELTDEQEKQIRFIKHSTEGLTELVNDLLDLAKVEAGKIIVKPEKFEVHQLFATLRGMFKPLLINPEISLVFQEPEEIFTLFTDEGKISQILRNFISNSLKFTEKGQIRIRVEDKNDIYVTFSVSDTGIGIDEKDQSYIFEEFSQVESRIQKKVKGTGLGLPLSQKLAELLGGSIWVKSTPGEGSTFFLKVPINLTAADTAGMSLSENQINSRKILIIDDEDVARYILRGLLAGSGYEIFEAEEGLRGIDMAERIQPSVIFLDLIMPEMNGFEVLQKLKSNAATSSIPVIVNTSKILEPSEISALSGKAAAIVSKRDISKEGSVEKLRTIITEVIS